MFLSEKNFFSNNGMLLESFNFGISFLKITTTENIPTYQTHEQYTHFKIGFTCFSFFCSLAKSLVLVMKNGSNKPTYLFCQTSSYILLKVHAIYKIQPPLKKVKIYIPISKMGASAQ